MIALLLGVARAEDVSFADALREAAGAGPSARIAEAEYRQRAGEAQALRSVDDPRVEAERVLDETTVTVGVPVPISGAPVAGAAAARSERDAALVRRDAATARAALAAGGAYLDLVRAEGLAALADESLSLAVRSRDATARLLEAGEIGAVDAIVAASIAARAANDASAARQDALRARRALEVAMGRSPVATVEPLGWPELPVPDQGELPDVVAAGLDARAAAARRTRAVLGVVPTPEVRAGWGRTHDGEGVVLGAAIEVPVLSPGVGRVRAADAEADRARAESDRVRLEAEAARAGAASDLAAAVAAYEVARIEGLDVALAQLAAAFDAGEYSLAEYVARRDAVLAGAVAAIDARHRLERARLELWRLEGRVPPEAP